MSTNIATERHGMSATGRERTLRSRGGRCRLSTMSRVSAATLLIAALTTGCDRPQPKVDAKTLKQIRAAGPGMTAACLDRIKYGGLQAMPLNVEECFQMGPSRRWHGLWRDDFEGQRFCPTPKRQCSSDRGDDQIWITFKAGTRPFRGGPTGKTYSISFVGRRTLAPGPHGHMGLSAHEIVVDKLLSITPLGADRSSG